MSIDREHDSERQTQVKRTKAQMYDEIDFPADEFGQQEPSPYDGTYSEE